ncbi:MAG: hypothetical protein IJH55_01855 [Romboutsia sp.]|nr:hypothetical protein [Romboutsia sp.]
MKTTTKAEILKKFENKEFIQINWPKMNETEPITMRSEIQNIDHFNTIYRDGKKLYLEDTANAISRLAKRIFKTDLVGLDTLEDLEYYLYLADYDFKEAKELYLEEH